MNVSSPPRGFRLLAGLAGVLVLISACDMDVTPNQTPSSGGGTARVVNTPPQPYDVLRGDDYATIDLAHLRLRDQCLANAGYPQSQEATGAFQGNNPAVGLLVSASTFGPTSEDEARRLGFGHDYPGEPAHLASFDDSFNAKLGACGSEAWSKLDPDAQTAMSSFGDLINLLAPYYREVPAEPELVGELFDCLTEKGYDGDREAFLGPNGPEAFEIPRGSLEPWSGSTWEPTPEPGTVQVGPVMPLRHYVPTPQESDFAVAWFLCDQGVGWAQTTLEANFAAQQEYVDRYETRITEENERITALAHTASTYL